MEARAKCGGIGIASDEVKRTTVRIEKKRLFQRKEISVFNIPPNTTCSWIIMRPLEGLIIELVFE